MPTSKLWLAAVSSVGIGQTSTVSLHSLSLLHIPTTSGVHPSCSAGFSSSSLFLLVTQSILHFANLFQCVLESLHPLIIVFFKTTPSLFDTLSFMLLSSEEPFWLKPNYFGPSHLSPLSVAASGPVPPVFSLSLMRPTSDVA